MTTHVGGRKRPGMSRRQVLKAGASGFAMTSAIGIAPKYLISPARAAEYGPGMTGGPTGFPGAERYQYNESMAAGRAIEAVKELKAAGKAPEKLVVAMVDGAIGHFMNAAPAGAPTVIEVWEKETGVQDRADRRSTRRSLHQDAAGRDHRGRPLRRLLHPR